MKRIISASRRTDLIAFFPGYLARALKQENARIVRPRGGILEVDLNPDSVHTIVIWSKDFSNLISNRDELRELLMKYDQIFLHFTITGLGSLRIESGVPSWRQTIQQIDPLIELAGSPERISLRFDPVVFWKEQGEIRSNRCIFNEMAPILRSKGIRSMIFSFAQPYSKAGRRWERSGLKFVDPPLDEKLRIARELALEAGEYGLKLSACGQDFLSQVEGVSVSKCIDGAKLSSLHPEGTPADLKKDRSQRKECHCTVSVDIGSYTQSCPHSCLYCYANPRL